MVRIATAASVTCTTGPMSNGAPANGFDPPAVRTNSTGPMNTRKSAKTPIFFEPPARNALMSDGAPS